VVHSRETRRGACDEVVLFPRCATGMRMVPRGEKFLPAFGCWASIGRTACESSHDAGACFEAGRAQLGEPAHFHSRS